MTAAAHRYKILAHMFGRAIRNLDQIQNSSTAHGLYIRSKQNRHRERCYPRGC
jgi:hypothetical protein